MLSRSGLTLSQSCDRLGRDRHRIVGHARGRPFRPRINQGGNVVRRIIQVALIVAGLIHFLPVTGVIGAERLTAMYAIPFADPNLLILMRHRAVMLGLLGGLVLYSVFRPGMQGTGIVVGTVSLASIVGLAWSVGGYNQSLSRVVMADSVAVFCFLVAAALRARLHA